MFTNTPTIPCHFDHAVIFCLCASLFDFLKTQMRYPCTKMDTHALWQALKHHRGKQTKDAWSILNTFKQLLYFVCYRYYIEYNEEWRQCSDISWHSRQSCRTLTSFGKWDLVFETKSNLILWRNIHQEYYMIFVFLKALFRTLINVIC